MQTLLHFIRNLTAPQRTKMADVQLGVMLAFVAGAVNAGGFLAVGYYTSHMTGIASSIGDFIALHKFTAAWAAMAYLCTFITGAAFSAFTINWARTKHLHSEFAIPLLVEATLLLLFGVLAANTLQYGTIYLHITIALLCFIMGLQNALITKLSHAEIRTTHVTGMVTDIGIELGRYLYRKLSHHTGVAFRPEKLRLNVALLLAFVIGGIIGAVSFQSLGFISITPLALMLGIVAIIPISDDFTSPTRS